MTFLTKQLNSLHNRKNFSCGIKMLDNYIYFQVNQDVKRKLSVCFVLENEEDSSLKGYYTLSNTGINLDLFPEKILKKMPKSYEKLPAILLGRLAVDKNHQGIGIGELLLLDALNRSFQLSLKIGSFCVVVDPINEITENFYNKYGFIKLNDSGKMFLPMKQIKPLFSN